MKKRKYSNYWQVIPGVLLVLALIGIVFGTGVATRNTVDLQAVEYLDQASDRSADELKKSFLRQQENILTMAHMTAHIMDYEYIDTEKLVHLTANSSFDGIEYIHGSGKCYGMDEQSWDVKEKAYFQDAMQQHVGYAYDDAPERSAEGCLVFYAPILSDDGDFYGILVGYLQEKTIASMLDVSFWGHSSKLYLCTEEGTIIAANDQGKAGSDILELFRANGEITNDNLDSLLKEKQGNFRYTVGEQTELGSIGAVDDGKLLLVETFPPEVLSQLTEPLQHKMRFAFVHVIISLSLYGIIMFVISRRNVNRLKDENEKVNILLKGAEGLANHDGLTGLYNRRGMTDAIAGLKTEEAPMALLVMDIDHFKQINDSYGHQTGDELLIKVSRLLRETFRAEDLLVRMGGDEFIVLLPNFKREQADIIKKKVHDMNSKLQTPSDGLPAFSVSAGAAFRKQGEKEELFLRADKALYERKARGRCGCCIYEEVFEDQTD